MQQMNMPLPGPEIMGPAFLAQIKKPRVVKNIRVWLTHSNIHDIWADNNRLARKFRAQYPLSISMPRLGLDPEVINCRNFTVAWDVDVRTPEEKLKALAAIAKAPDPKHALLADQGLVRDVEQEIAARGGSEFPPSPASLP